MSDFRERIPHHVDRWDVVPFEKLPGVHFARFILLKATEDLDHRPVPAQLVLMTDVDAPFAGHIEQLSTVCGEGMDKVFSHCAGYPAPADRSPKTRRAFLQERMTKSSAAHINRRGRSVAQIQQEEFLRREINRYIDSGDLASLEIRDSLQSLLSRVSDR